MSGTAPIAAPWSLAPEDALAALGATRDGLTATEAAARLERYGRNALAPHRDASWARIVLRQLANPLLLLLVLAAVVSLIGREWIDAAIVLGIIVASVGVSASREYSAQSAADALRARVQMHAMTLRDGVAAPLPASALVPGDVVLFSAGTLVPADCVLLESTDLHVSESVLTGESFPVEKTPGAVAPDATIAARRGMLFLGTNVRSGTARAVVVATGPRTEFGAVAQRLTLRPPETEFERGTRRFGYVLTIAMLVMVLVVFAAHMLRGRPPMETLLFAIALAVGLSPELLPAILSVNLARSATLMSQGGVLVRRLNAIENLGSMDVLCTDKTGTLTEGVVEVEGSYDPRGLADPFALDLAARNAALETGVDNPLDEAILRAHKADLGGVSKLAEIPFDFVRKRVSVVMREGGAPRMITKGAVAHVLEVCAQVRGGGALDDAARAAVDARVRAWSEQGVRVIAVASGPVAAQPRYGRGDERGLTLDGFVSFLDRPKAGVARAIEDLKRLGVDTKIISGDSKLVTQHVARLVGLDAERVLTGADIDRMHDEAFWHAAEKTALFCEVDPNQKERILLSLKKMGHVVGFLGDGVNDAPAMHCADASLSVKGAVDVAREAADFVLLDRELDVIRRGIEQGRRTFANTLKYVLTTTSANLGNMASMALASLYLPFLPLLAGQVLLNNFLSDIPAVGLADDAVDPELVARPRRWDLRFIARFMVEFGLLSSAFDLFTFAALRFVYHAPPAAFRTGWFVESLLTELVIALVVRTRRPFFKSRPGTLLLGSTAVIVALALALPYLPVVAPLGLVPLPLGVLGAVGAITVAYVLSAELLKHHFYRGADTVTARRA